MAKKAKSGGDKAPESQAPASKAPASQKAPADPAALQAQLVKTMGTRLGLPLLGVWLVAAFLRHWVGFAVAGALTVAAAGLVVWTWRRVERSKKLASIVQSVDVQNKEGRKAALEQLDANFKGDDVAAQVTRAQLLMQDDPEKAQEVLEGIDLSKSLPAEADQVRFQRALIHLTKGETDRARALVDLIDVTRQEDRKARAMVSAVIAEAWGRTGQARKGLEMLEHFDPADAELAELAPQLYRAKAFIYASLNDTKQMRQALKKLAAQNPQYLAIFMAKKVHPLLVQEAKVLYAQAGMMPKAKPNYARR